VASAREALGLTRPEVAEQPHRRITGRDALLPPAGRPKLATETGSGGDGARAALDCPRLINDELAGR